MSTYTKFILVNGNAHILQDPAQRTWGMSGKPEPFWVGVEVYPSGNPMMRSLGNGRLTERIRMFLPEEISEMQPLVQVDRLRCLMTPEEARLDAFTMRSIDLVDPERPELGRRVRVTRTLPVEALTPLECQALLGHCHHASPKRHKAYWEKWWAWRQTPEGDAWDKSVCDKRQAKEERREAALAESARGEAKVPLVEDFVQLHETILLLLAAGRACVNACRNIANGFAEPNDALKEVEERWNTVAEHAGKALQRKL